MRQPAGIIQCPVCRRAYEPVLKSKNDSRCIQDEFPNAQPWQREQLLSGICSDECWNNAFSWPEPED